MFALVDGNNFYASCERIFQPKLQRVPIVVLSNNDGCIIARSNEAKALDIPMGAPFHHWQGRLERANGTWFSANFPLYGDISHRMVECLRTFTKQIEVYSIDEVFLDLSEYAPQALEALGNDIVKSIQKWLGLPVSVGIAPTKTLAKLANRIAKKNPIFESCFCGAEQRNFDSFLEILPCEDIWGVGHKLAKRLAYARIYNAKQLKYADAKIIRKILSINGARTQQELWGIPVFTFDAQTPPKKQILCSRSFGSKITSLSELEEAIATYASRACDKLRKEKSLCDTIVIFVQTNRFSTQDEQYKNSYLQILPSPTADTAVIIHHAIKALHKIYKGNISYNKAGIILQNLVTDSAVQQTFFAESYSNKQRTLQETIDTLNKRYGDKILHHGAMGTNKRWKMRSKGRSPQYTTRWDQLAIIR